MLNSWEREEGIKCVREIYWKHFWEFRKNLAVNLVKNIVKNGNENAVGMSRIWDILKLYVETRTSCYCSQALSCRSLPFQNGELVFWKIDKCLKNPSFFDAILYTFSHFWSELYNSIPLGLVLHNISMLPIIFRPV